MRIFISHASEDHDFVEPLSIELRKEHQLWVDEDKLHVADSPRAEIDAGLLWCDFAIAILSPSYFAKIWPLRELDALLALETGARKIILPIRRGLTYQQLKGRSPLLAGPVSLDAEEGIASIVSKINLAASVSQLQRQLSETDAILECGAKLGNAMKEEKESKKLLYGQEGAKLVVDSQISLFRKLEELLTTLGERSSEMHFKIVQPPVPSRQTFYAIGPHRVGIDISLKDWWAENASTAVLDVEIFVFMRERGFANRLTSEPRYKVVEKWSFTPFISLTRVVMWCERDEDHIFTADTLSQFVVKQLLAEIKERFSG